MVASSAPLNAPRCDEISMIILIFLRSDTVSAGASAWGVDTVPSCVGAVPCFFVSSSIRSLLGYIIIYVHYILFV